MTSHANTNNAVVKVDVGTRPNSFPEWEAASAEVRFHAFEGLPTSSDDAVESPEFTCFGHQWSLTLYPGGISIVDEGEGMVAICLRHHSDQNIRIKYGFYVEGLDVPNLGGKFLERTFWFSTQRYSTGITIADFAKYSTLADILVEGTLVIEVRMKLLDSTSETNLPFIPENPLSKNILKKFMDETTADVLFEVCYESKGVEGRQKRLKISPATFHAHRLILVDSAPTLAELCKIGGGMTPVKITDVKPDTFRHILQYVYGGRIPHEYLKSRSKEIIDVADKYGAVNLKLEAEACYVQSTAVTMDNVIDNLIYANSKNCALLKEAVMDFLVENGGEAVEKLSFENIPGYLMKDMLTAVHMGKQEGKKDASDFSTMRVSTLRRMLHKKGLDVDGSREPMIALLKENS